MNTKRLLSGIATAALALLCLSGCGSSSKDAGASDNGPLASTSPSQPDTRQTDSLTVNDPWMKAAEKGMTAAFGVLVNGGTEPITITSASSAVASTIELHETVKNDDGTMSMQPKQGGFTLESSETHELAPGGDHIMLMNLARPVMPGQVVTLTLSMSDGSTKDVAFTVKNFTGADEKYKSGGGAEMSMG